MLFCWISINLFLGGYAAYFISPLQASITFVFHRLFEVCCIRSQGLPLADLPVAYRLHLGLLPALPGHCSGNHTLRVGGGKVFMFFYHANHSIAFCILCSRSRLYMCSIQSFIVELFGFKWQIFESWLIHKIGSAIQTSIYYMSNLLAPSCDIIARLGPTLHSIVSVR
jgi:hypothetical protein